LLLPSLKIFDSHFHIIDKPFPLIPNNGYIPESFTCDDYIHRMKIYNLAGGAVVSGSFQAFDQSYLLAALKKLGPRFVGVTQLPVTVSDDDILKLDKAGVRAIRFNVKGGGSETVDKLEIFAERVYEMVGWHVELYIDSNDLPDLYGILINLPSISIDHLGLSKAGFKTVLTLVEKGARVKASGFGRVDFDVKEAIKSICMANPDALMFGTDLPSTRAPRTYSDEDSLVVYETLGEAMAQKVFYDNAFAFYRPLSTT
jgi:predicted TIM-barrel fold metal-dependent hydrolase